MPRVRELRLDPANFRVVPEVGMEALLDMDTEQSEGEIYRNSLKD